MKKIKKFKDFDKHLKVYILLSNLIFTAMGIAHLNIIVNGLAININTIIIPNYSSYLALVISLGMIVMGTYYYKALGTNNK